VRQGEPGHQFFIVTQGRVAVSIDGRHVRDEGPGEWFGEIALLRNVPRTATVEAAESTELVAIGRSTFLEAITGLPASVSVAERHVEEQLRSDGLLAASVEEPVDASA
jgi:CRP-like cAMP-binding protein